MNRLKPVAYDVVEGEDRFVLVLRCVPLKGPIVQMLELPGRGFEFRDEEGGSIRFGNPHARMRMAPDRTMILVMIHGEDICIATTPGAMPFDRSTALIPPAFLWHHDRATAATDYAERPLAALLEHVVETTAGILCAPPLGAPVSACIHRRMAPLASGRDWTRVSSRLIVDAASLRTIVEVAEDVAGAVRDAFEPGGRPSCAGAAWRSQLAVRIAA
jgi:hypothetical protein